MAGEEESRSLDAVWVASEGWIGIISVLFVPPPLVSFPVPRVEGQAGFFPFVRQKSE